MTRAELFGGNWRIVKRDFNTKQVVGVSNKCYTSRRMAEAAYKRSRYTMKFNLVANSLV